MNRIDYILKKTFFNKYKPIKRIGEGSFARIYSAKNIKTNEKFALKMVNKIYKIKLIYRNIFHQIKTH